RIYARSARPFGNVRVLGGCVILRISTRAVPQGDVVEGEHVPATSSVIEGCCQKLLGGRRRCHSRPSCASSLLAGATSWASSQSPMSCRYPPLHAGHGWEFGTPAAK